jgi:hypothetical protein
VKNNCGGEVPDGPPNGHTWIVDDNGAVDVFVLDNGFHNGPGCSACGEWSCEHCTPDCWQEECSAFIEVKAVVVRPALPQPR